VASNVSSVLIGISTYAEDARWGVWNVPAALLPMAYVDGVTAAGGLPVLLPQTGDDPSALSAVDGLVLAGGADVDPSGYGHQPHEKTVSRPERDRFEFALLREAWRRRLPVLGVCRGMQVLNVALGGTLTQHLPDTTAGTAHQPGPATYGTTRVTFTEGTRVAGILGARADVHCYHHQAVDRLGTGLVATGRAADGTVEAVELPGEPFVVGAQWHPEQDNRDLRLFAALVRAARHRRATEAPNVPENREV
jgi:putative glutamine amidotransferase